MTRTLQALHQWVIRPAVIGCAALLSLLPTLILCLANFRIAKFVAVGGLAGIILWKWSRWWVRILFGIVMLQILIAACASESGSPPPPEFNWPAIYKFQIVLNSSGKTWTVNTRKTWNS